MEGCTAIAVQTDGNVANGKFKDKSTVERERENFICQVTTSNNLSIIIYNGWLPEKANAHQCWPPLTQ